MHFWWQLQGRAVSGGGGGGGNSSVLDANYPPNYLPMDYLLMAAPLATNCWPEAPIGGGGG